MLKVKLMFKSQLFNNTLDGTGMIRAFLNKVTELDILADTDDLSCKLMTHSVVAEATVAATATGGRDIRATEGSQ